MGRSDLIFTKPHLKIPGSVWTSPVFEVCMSMIDMQSCKDPPTREQTSEIIRFQDIGIGAFAFATMHIDLVRDLMYPFQ